MNKTQVGLPDADRKVERDDGMCPPVPKDKDETMPGM